MIAYVYHLHTWDFEERLSGERSKDSRYVIVASWLGLPVSSTHIAVGGVFGVGFFREWDAQRRMKAARLTIPEANDQPKEERQRRKLVRRSHFLTIIAAWIITVPAAAVLSAIIFFMINIFMS
jgi:PiT family inorganic phosphate transporter